MTYLKVEKSWIQNRLDMRFRYSSKDFLKIIKNFERMIELDCKIAEPLLYERKFSELYIPIIFICLNLLFHIYSSITCGLQFSV